MMLVLESFLIAAAGKNDKVKNKIKKKNINKKKKTQSNKPAQ